MAKITSTVNDDGSASVTVEEDETLLNDTEKQSSKWTTTRADQTEKLIPTWRDSKRPAEKRMTAGDESAMRDQLNEITKQRNS